MSAIDEFYEASVNDGDVKGKQSTMMAGPKPSLSLAEERLSAALFAVIDEQEARRLKHGRVQ